MVSTRYGRELIKRAMGLGGDIGSDGRYLPEESEIRSSKPDYNTFYRGPKNKTRTVSQIANVAATRAGEKGQTANATVAMANSTWNQHIKYGSSGWTSYGIQGPQYLKKYAMDPRATVGTGNNYPVIWVVDPNDPKEPEEHFGLYPTPEPSPEPPAPPDPYQGPPGPMGPAGPAGPAGPKGAKGAKGAAGPAGAMGPPGEATDEQINAAILAYLAEHPPPGGPMGPEGPMGPAGPPGEATAEAINAAVFQYLTDNPPPAGPEGLPGPVGPAGPAGAIGPAGPRGPMGPAGSGEGGGLTAEQVNILIEDYIGENKEQFNDLIDSRIRKYVREHPGIAGGGGATAGGGFLALPILSAMAAIA